MADKMIVGMDGISPAYDEEGLWRTWALPELWMGEGNGEGKHVPKIDDYVRDPQTFRTWIVDHLDNVTKKPTLREIVPYGVAQAMDESSLFGVTPGSEIHRGYLNDTVFPYTFVVSQRYFVGGSLSSYAKLFKGVDTTAGGTVISKRFNNSGEFVTDQIPLELAAIDSHVNYTLKTVMPFVITEKLVDNEIVTLVTYSDDGHVVKIDQLLVTNTDTINPLSKGTRYITDISLKSIWLDDTGSILKYPLNIPMDALNLVGVVHYDSGVTQEFPVGGQKFTMLGLDGRLSSIIGQEQKLVLRYVLSKDEVCVASAGVNGKYITKPYSIVTINPNNSVDAKLFGYPRWVDENYGYELDFYLLNKARNVWFNVTGQVKFSPKGRGFNPKLYGVIQRIPISINLRDVSQSFIPFQHSQVIDIHLVSPPTNDLVPAWFVHTEASDTRPYFGDGIYGEITDKRVNFGAAFTNVQDWLKAYYERAMPITDPTSESGLPTPSHFIVLSNGTSTEWPMAQWNQALSIEETPVAGRTVSIRFIKRTAAGDLQLAIVAAMLKKP